MNNQGNITQPKETNKTSMTNPKEMEINEQSGKELRIIFLKKISELQKKKDRQLYDIRKTMHEHNERFKKKNRNFFKKQNKSPRVEEYND